MMLRVRNVLFACVCLFGLQGCFWGLFGGSVKVENDTDDEIHVEVEQSDVNDGSYYPGVKSIEPGHSEHYPLHVFSFTPRVKVDYQGKHRVYRTNLDFLGLDTVYVNTADFIAAAN